MMDFQAWELHHSNIKLVVFRVFIELLGLYPLIVNPFYPQKKKNDVSTNLCDESQPINLVW